MKLSNIKTKTEFYKCVDIWYQRAHRLREIWQNPKESGKRRIKATALWVIMQRKVMTCHAIALQINKSKYPILK